MHENVKGENVSVQKQLNATLEQFLVDAANAKADAEKRDKTLLITLSGFIIDDVTIDVTVLGSWLG
ncbi:MAG: hypothetical protein OXC62_15210 [Aestuariivita sp.]|nr:hypothetical protein [Aestuariivita sp.]